METLNIKVFHLCDFHVFNFIPQFLTKTDIINLVLSPLTLFLTSFSSSSFSSSASVAITGCNISLVSTGFPGSNAAVLHICFIVSHRLDSVL